jgi:hypothetical protein
MAKPAAVGNARNGLTNSVQRQDRSCVSTPPSNNPTAPPLPAIAPKMPNALFRSAGSENVVVNTASTDGASSAPNAPWRARAATSQPKLWARPPTAEIAANPIRPVRNVGLRPNMSPIRPPRGSKLPNASAYAVMTHWRSPFEKCSARWADGSAIFTIVASSTTITCATPTTARISQRRAYVGSGAVSVVMDTRASCVPA